MTYFTKTNVILGITFFLILLIAIGVIVYLVCFNKNNCLSSPTLSTTSSFKDDKDGKKKKDPYFVSSLHISDQKGENKECLSRNNTKT